MESTSKIPVSVYAEMTPNPAVLKFVANKRLIEADSLEFKNIEEAKSSPLATRLFHFPFVKEIFVSGNYLAITKYDIVEWEDVTLEIREMVRDFVASGEQVVNEIAFSETSDAEQVHSVSETPSAHPEEKAPEDYLEIEKKIVSLLDEYVKPAVEQDGGNIKFLQYDEGTVKVLLQGACSGCPSSTMTLKQGIQNLLNQMLPGQINQVVAVNG
ncbi:MAG: NifU family protein [Owenweeksia sp.]